MSGRTRAGWSRIAAVPGSVAMLLTGLCLLAAPTACADLDDVFDTIISGPGTGADSAEAVGTEAQTGVVNFSAVNDPLAQLAALFRDAPSGSAWGPSEPEEADRSPGGALPQNENTDSGDDSSSPPKLSMPSSGNGGSGGNGNGSGGSGSHSGNTAKAKSHSSSTKGPADLPKADGDDNR